jgi:thiopurine S-methyltransferase
MIFLSQRVSESYVELVARRAQCLAVIAPYVKSSFGVLRYTNKPYKWTYMKHDFWHYKWQKNEIGFHLPEANPLLVKYFPTLNLTQGTRIFLPLCGKTLDIAWLLTQGYRVAGAELSQIAIEDLFKNLNLTPTITKLGEITHYSAPNIDIFVGDIFKVTPAMLGVVDAVYDRAALVALPEEMRKQYSAHLMTLTNKVPQLLICFEYDQSLHAGPPFSISADEVSQHYQSAYKLNLLASVEVEGGLKGQCTAIEHVWWLKPLN